MNTRFAVNTKGISLLAGALCILASGGQAKAANLLVPSQYRTIQAGIDAAKNGDTVIITNGTYTGVGNRDINLRGKAITVRPAIEGQYQFCVIDCQGSGRGFYFGNRETSATVVRGFLISNGAAPNGGGIACENYSNPTIVNCIVTNSRATAGNGGAVYIRNSSPTMTNGYYSGNRAVFGGGVAVIEGSPSFTNCAFSGNNSSYDGGAIYNINVSGITGKPTYTGCNISGNTAGYESGGGMFNRNCSPTVQNCYFAQNKAPGGGAICNWECNPIISNSTFIRNTAGRRNGGAINSIRGSLTVLQCSFKENSAEMIPATPYREGYGGAIESINATVNISGSSFEGNRANVGGGISCSSSRTTITGCLIKKNQASIQGGGVLVFDGSTTVINAVIAENTNNGLNASDGDLLVMNSTITRNSGYGVYVNTSDAMFVNSILWGNTNRDLFGGSPFESGVLNSILGTWGAEDELYQANLSNTLRTDPLFVNAAGGDYRLKAGSPAINKGDNDILRSLFPGITTDIAGNARIRGGVIDMGAYEY